MATIKYKCDNCKHEYVGNDYTLECPKCGSQDITPSGTAFNLVDGILQYFKDNRTIGYILMVIILVVLIFCIKECNTPPEKSTYNITPQAMGNYIQVTITKKYKDDNGKLKKEKLEGNVYDRAVKAFKFKDRDGNLIQFIGNKIYPCDSGQFLIQWTNSHNFPLKKPKKLTKKSYPIRFPSGMPNPKAKCPIKLTILNVVADDNCQMVITTNLDTMLGKKVKISTDGRGGSYKIQKTWPAKGYAKIDVWAHEDGIDTNATAPVAYGDNYEPFRPRGCDKMSAADLKKRMADFINVANAYGKNPERKLTSKLKKYLDLNNINNKFYLNGVEMDFGELHPAIKTSFNNDQTTYELHKDPIYESHTKIDSFGVIYQFKFVTLN